MTDFIRLMNNADRRAKHYLRGTMAAIVLSDWLVEHGFYDIRIGGQVIARLNGVRFDLGAE